MLDDLAALRKDVSDEVKDFKFQLFRADAHHVIDGMHFILVALAPLEDVHILSDLIPMLLDNALYFPLLFLDFLDQFSLIHSPGPSLFEVVSLDDLMLYLGKIFLHALHHNISMIFHEDFFKTSAAFELKAG